MRNYFAPRGHRIRVTDDNVAIYADLVEAGICKPGTYLTMPQGTTEMRKVPIGRMSYGKQRMVRRRVVTAEGLRHLSGAEPSRRYMGDEAGNWVSDTLARGMGLNASMKKGLGARLGVPPKHPQPAVTTLPPLPDHLVQALTIAAKPKPLEVGGAPPAPEHLKQVLATPQPQPPGVELANIPFDGGTLQAIREGETVWVSVKRVCEALGIDEATQARKLKEKAWACTVMMTAHDTTGRKQDAFCISLKSLPMWLATIEASRVQEAVRPKLLKFQLDAAKVLADHFFGASQPKPGLMRAPNGGDVLSTLRSQAEQQIQLIGELEKHALAIDSVKVSASTAQGLATAACQRVTWLETESRAAHQRLISATTSGFEEMWRRVENLEQAPGRDLTATISAEVSEHVEAVGAEIKQQLFSHLREALRTTAPEPPKPEPPKPAVVKLPTYDEKIDSAISEAKALGEERVSAVRATGLTGLKGWDHALSWTCIHDVFHERHGVDVDALVAKAEQEHAALRGSDGEISDVRAICVYGKGELWRRCIPEGISRWKEKVRAKRRRNHFNPTPD